MDQSQIKKLASIIGDFRQGELTIPLDEAHVQKWLAQFTESKQDVILSETIHILSEWYFDVEALKKYLQEVYQKILELYGSLADVGFLNIQQEGKSQSMLIDLLYQMGMLERQNNQFKCKKHAVYIDDGLYSGKHIIKDIKRLLDSEEYTEVTSIDVFVLIGYTSGIQYVTSELEQLCNSKCIKFALYRYKELRNDKTIKYINSGEEYISDQDYLWPLPPHMLAADDIEYTIERITYSKIHFCYRDYSRHYTSRIFSSEEARIALENEFLEKGTRILPQDSIQKGLYPLGFSPYPSLGFGSFCATAMNISNTCPIVLWWGSIEQKGNALDEWYPLLPRRVNNS